MTTPLDGLTLSLSEAASAFMLSPRRLQQLTKEGHAPKAERGRYPFLPLLQGYLQFVRAEERTSSRDAEDELKQIRIRRERRKEAVELGKLVPIEDAEFFLDQFVGLVNLHLNNIPARYTRDLDERDRLQEHIDEVSKTVADGLEKCSQALRANLDAHPAEVEDTEDD